MSNNGKILFLTSSPAGPLDKSRETDGLDTMNRFVDYLKKYWKENSRCLMIAAFPDNYEQNDEMTGYFREIFEKKGLTCASFDLWDSRTSECSEDVLLSYDCVFLAGGHVPTQNRFFQQISLRGKLEKYQGIVIGISAGTMNSADMVYAQPELPGESEDSEYRRFLAGLGLTKTMILPHYQMVKDDRLDGKRLYEEITYADSMGHSFLALPDGSYLLSVNGKETVYGEAYEIKDGKMRQICRNGESILY